MRRRLSNNSSACGHEGPDAFLAVTDAGGKFGAGGLPAGLWIACVQVANSDFLEVCRWPQRPGAVQLNNGQSMVLPTIRLVKGVRLKIRLDDTTLRLPHSKATDFSGNVVVGMAAAGAPFVHATPLAADGNGFDLEVLAPYDTPLTFTAFSRGLELNDDEGKGAHAVLGVVKTIRVAGGSGTPAPIRVTIAGEKPCVSGTCWFGLDFGWRRAVGRGHRGTGRRRCPGRST